MAVTLLFFARVREAVGHGSEVRELPETVATPAALALWLAGQGAGYAEAFADPARLRCAVDQVMMAMDAPLDQPREIAFFPPVTGG